MKPQQWLPAAVFLAVSIPVVMLLNALQWGGDYKVWLAIALGVIASGLAMNRLGRQEQDSGKEQA